LSPSLRSEPALTPAACLRRHEPVPSRVEGFTPAKAGADWGWFCRWLNMYAGLPAGYLLNLEFLRLKFELLTLFRRFIDLQYGYSRLVADFRGAAKFYPAADGIEEIL
jgi:hypothetical protein